MGAYGGRSLVDLSGAAVGTTVLASQVVGDTEKRFTMTADGSMTWREAGQAAGQYLFQFIPANDTTDPNFNLVMKPIGNGFGSPIPNDHARLGWNPGSSIVAPQNTDYPSFAICFENYYLQSVGNPLSEIYIEYQTASGTPTTWRPWAAYVNQSTAVTNLEFKADTVTTYSRSTGLIIGQHDSSNYTYGFYAAAAALNVIISPAAFQIKISSDGTNYCDVTVDGSDNLTLNSFGSYVILNGVGYVIKGATAETQWLQRAFTLTTSDSGNTLRLGVSNTSNTAGSASRLSAIVAGTSAGDAFVYLAVTGGQDYYIGVDNSVANDPLCIGTGGTVGGADKLRVFANGDVAVGSAAIATTAVAGFLYVPTCAGAPTGVPTGIAGLAPVVVDTTNNRWYFYSGGAWRNAGP